VKIEPSESLRNLQQTAGDVLAPYVHKADILPSVFQSEPFSSSYCRYGFPFVGDHWIPHLSVASLRVPRDHPLLRELCDMALCYRFTIGQVSVWRVQDDQHARLATVYLKKE
jgi:hypothetical protein